MIAGGPPTVCASSTIRGLQPDDELDSLELLEYAVAGYRPLDPITLAGDRALFSLADKPAVPLGLSSQLAPRIAHEVDVVTIFGPHG